MSLDWIYWGISWILLTWHGIWDTIGVPDAAVLGTNWAWILAIIFLVISVRVILFPVFVKQIKSQRAMQALQPKVKELQEKHKGDRETLQKEMMELYRAEKANPLMGCLPIFLQIPVFLGLFHVLRRLNPQREDDKTAIYGWTYDQFHDASLARLFDAPIASKFGSTAAELAAMDANGTTVKIVTAILVIIMIVTTYLTTAQMIKRTGRAEDPQQKMIQNLMLYGIPASLLFSGAIFPVGVIIYWVTNNLFSLAQQQWVLRKYPPPPTVNKGATAGRGTAASRSGPPARTGPPAKGPLSKGTGSKGLGGRGADAKGADSRNGKDAGTPPQVDGKALAPKPGAKPVRPRKGGPAKRPTG
ncbi:MAG TPA: membrane protein insertase YidC [Pilimelia sp.]|nr:membrane protein insertase YidC [Pilimelia sp.]